MKCYLLKYIGLLLCFTLPVQADTPEHQNLFDIWEFQVAGNSLLETSEIESTLYPYLGVNRDLQVIETARDRLQVLYKQKGFPIVVVSIPQQNVVAGVVQLQVTEGLIDRVKITGNEYFSRDALRKELPALRAGQPLNMNSVRSEVDAVNRLNPYRSILPVIRPGRYPGTMEMELKVHDKLPLHASIETNNRYTASTSHTRLSASAGYDNLWQAHHSVTIGYQTSPEDTAQVNVYNINYALPTGTDSRLVLYAVKSDSNVATVTAEGDSLNVLGNGRIVGARSMYPIRTDASYFHSLTFGADYKDFGEAQQLANQQNSNGLNVPISYINWTVAYSGNIRHEFSSTQMSVTNNFGVRSIANEQDEFEFKRDLAKPNYFYLQAGINQDQALTQTLALSYGLRGQYTTSPLISNEEISAGGVDSVRGYLESSALGDNGLIGNVQLNYAVFADKPPAHVQTFVLSVYTDAARLHVLNALPDVNNEINDRSKLFSAGIGMELQAFDGMSLKLYAAKPLYRLQQDGFDDAVKLHFSLGYAF